jgi:hypothetical protein
MKGVEQTLLVKWLRSLPWSDEQQARLTEVLRLYCVASCPHGPEWVAFWQITHDGVPLTAKYMRYHADGHRVKDRDAQNRKVFASDWEHAWRARMKQYDADKWDTSSRALFGCHLLAKYPQASVSEDCRHKLCQHKRLSVFLLSADGRKSSDLGEWHSVELKYGVRFRVVIARV